MAVYFVDAGELDGVANATSNARNDLYWTLRPLEFGSAAVPWQRDTQGQWNEIRGLINRELGWMDGDARSIHDRAQRVRIASQSGLTTPTALRFFIGGGAGWLPFVAGKVAWSFGEALLTEGIKKSPAWAMRHITRGWTTTGARTISGGHLARWLSGVKGAPVLTQHNLVLRHAAQLRNAKYVSTGVGIAITAWFAFQDNRRDYGSDRRAVAVGTVLDTALKVAPVLAVGALMAPGLPAIAAVVVTGVVASIAVDYLRKTPQYKEFVRNPVKAVDQGIKATASTIEGLGSWLSEPKFALST